MMTKSLNQYDIIVWPDPKILHWDPIPPFDICLHNIFENDRYAYWSNKTDIQQSRKNYESVQDSKKQFNFRGVKDSPDSTKKGRRKDRS